MPSASRDFLKHYDIFKIGFALVTSLYIGRAVFDPASWHFLDNVNLIIHEAGHIFFFFGGDFIAASGGTLMQILLPFVFVGYFFLNRQFYSASIVLFWLVSSVMNVYVYAADAQVMQLDLLGGDSVGHDWNFMLGYLGVLQHTDVIAGAIRISGIVIFALAVVFSFLTARKSEPQPLDF